MTTLMRPQGVRTGPEGLPEHTLGWQVLGWTSEYLLQPDGPNAGQPWEYTDEQARFILWWYAIDRQGRFLYRRGMLRRMKGWGKDPVGASLCCVEFVGPCRFSHWSDGDPVAVPHTAAWVQTAAVSKDQTRNTMTLFPGMLSPRAIEEYDIDLGIEIIYGFRRRRAGWHPRIEAVTSSPRALEGGRATFVLKNETHHWLKSNEGHEMAKVIARNAAKSRDGSSRVLAISNAHDPADDSDAQHDHEAYIAIQTGESRATGFLYDSLEAPPDVELKVDRTGPNGEITAEDLQRSRESLRNGLLAARGGSTWLDVDRLIEEIYDPGTEESTSQRFYLNQIVAGADAWITPQDWDALAAPAKVVEPKELITLGLDGSKGGEHRVSYDHTVLMACRVSDSHLFPIGAWDPAQYADNMIPTADVDATVRNAFALYDVVGFYADVNEWESYTDNWEQDLGAGLCARATERHPIKWDMRRSREAALGVEAYHDAIMEKDLSHSGDARINQYHYNARRRRYVSGSTEIITFGKESPFSSRKVDGAAAAMLARKARQDYMALPEEKKRQKQQFAGVSWV